MPPKQKHSDGDADTLLSALRIKTVATFISALMVLYSFFGSIYRIPIQMEQHSKELMKLEATLEAINAKVTDVEKKVISKEEILLESIRTRTRVELLEKAEAGEVATQAQIERLTADWKELTHRIDTLSTQIAQLSANVVTLKETVAETHRSLDELKSK